MTASLTGTRTAGAGSRVLPSLPLIALIVAAGIVSLGAIFFGLWFASTAGVGKVFEFGFVADYAAPLAGGLAAAPSLTGSSPESIVYAAYDSVTISGALDVMGAPRTLLAIATALPFALVVAGCVGVVIISIRILAQRPFDAAARGVLWVLAALTIAHSVAVPWLEAASTALAISILGLPTSAAAASASEGWVLAPSFDFLSDTLWPSLALGTVLVLIATLWGRAARLQRDTEGLI